MTTHSRTSPVTRETSAYVRDKGLRPIIIRVTGAIVEMRAKGLRSREVLDISSMYYAAIRQRLAAAKVERKATRRRK